MPARWATSAIEICARPTSAATATAASRTRSGCSAATGATLERGLRPAYGQTGGTKPYAAGSGSGPQIAVGPDRGLSFMQLSHVVRAARYPSRFGSLPQRAAICSWVRPSCWPFVAHSRHCALACSRPAGGGGGPGTVVVGVSTGRVLAVGGGGSVVGLVTALTGGTVTAAAVAGGEATVVVTIGSTVVARAVVVTVVGSSG